MRGLGEFNIYRMAVMRGGKGGMLVVWNIIIFFGHFHFLFWGCGMQGSLDPSKEIDKSRIRNMPSILH